MGFIGLQNRHMLLTWNLNATVSEDYQSVGHVMDSLTNPISRVCLAASCPSDRATRWASSTSARDTSPICTLTRVQSIRNSVPKQKLPLLLSLLFRSELLVCLCSRCRQNSGLHADLKRLVRAGVDHRAPAGHLEPRVVAARAACGRRARGPARALRGAPLRRADLRRLPARRLGLSVRIQQTDFGLPKVDQSRTLIITVLYYTVCYLQ